MRAAWTAQQGLLLISLSLSSVFVPACNITCVLWTQFIRMPHLCQFNTSQLCPLQPCKVWLFLCLYTFFKDAESYCNEVIFKNLATQEMLVVLCFCGF